MLTENKIYFTNAFETLDNLVKNNQFNWKTHHDKVFYLLFHASTREYSSGCNISAHQIRKAFELINSLNLEELKEDATLKTIVNYVSISLFDKDTLPKFLNLAFKDYICSLMSYKYSFSGIGHNRDLYLHYVKYIFLKILMIRKEFTTDDVHLLSESMIFYDNQWEDYAFIVKRNIFTFDYQSLLKFNEWTIQNFDVSTLILLIEFCCSTKYAKDWDWFYGKRKNKRVYRKR